MALPVPSKAASVDLDAGGSQTAEGVIPVLLIGPQDARRGVLRDILAPPQWDTREATTYHEALRILDRRRIAVAICDTEIDAGNWQVLLAHLQSCAHPPNLIVSSRLADERLWAEVLNLGGYDVLVQPFDCGEVLRVARMAWMDWRQNRQSFGAPAIGKLCARAAAC